MIRLDVNTMLPTIRLALASCSMFGLWPVDTANAARRSQCHWHHNFQQPQNARRKVGVGVGAGSGRAHMAFLPLRTTFQSSSSPPPHELSASWACPSTTSSAHHFLS
jgi:hypothetical protein